jgi:hypothetical protein
LKGNHYSSPLLLLAHSIDAKTPQKIFFIPAASAAHFLSLYHFKGVSTPVEEK